MSIVHIGEHLWSLTDEERHEVDHQGADAGDVRDPADGDPAQGVRDADHRDEEGSLLRRQPRARAHLQQSGTLQPLPSRVSRPVPTAGM